MNFVQRDSRPRALFPLLAFAFETGRGRRAVTVVVVVSVSTTGSAATDTRVAQIVATNHFIAFTATISIRVIFGAACLYRLFVECSQGIKQCGTRVSVAKCDARAPFAV